MPYYGDLTTGLSMRGWKASVALSFSTMTTRLVGTAGEGLDDMPALARETATIGAPSSAAGMQRKQ